MKLHLGNQDINLNNAMNAFKLYNDKLIGDIYYECKPEYTARKDSTNCPQMIGVFQVNKILPYQFGDDVVERVKRKRLSLFECGFNDYEHSFQVMNIEPTINNTNFSLIETETFNSNGYDYVRDCYEFTYTIQWDNNTFTQMSGTTRIYILNMVHYKDDNCEFTFNYTGESKLVRNEVVFEDNITTDGYLGTHILTFEHYFNGEKFDETSYRTILLNGNS